MSRSSRPFVHPDTNSRRQVSKREALLCVMILSCAVASVSARAQVATQLTPKARQQIAALQAERESFTPAQRKIHTPLLHAARQATTGVASAAVPTLRANVATEADGRVKVRLTANVTPELAAFIRTQGGTVTASYAKYRAIYATLPFTSLETVAARADVDFIDTPPKAAFQGPGKPTSSTGAPTIHSWFNQSQAFHTLATETAINDPEGDVTHGAATVRAQYGVSGAGVKVGVISNSIDDPTGDYQNALINGYVTNLTVLPGQAGPSSSDGEGLAMCEVVHRIVPDASLYYATSITGNGSDDTANQEQMATNINTMVADGCRVILDDIFFENENPFQDSGPVAQAVIAASNAGVLYFSCSANYGNEDSGTSSCWEGDFAAGTDKLENGETVLSFTTDQNGTEELNTVTTGNNGADVYLFWADPSGKVKAQYHLYEYSEEQGFIQEASDATTGDPVQHLENVTSGNSIIVTQASGSPGRFLHLDVTTQNSSLAYSTAGRARGHNTTNAINAFTVAATPAAKSGGSNADGPYPGLFNSSNQIESFSNDGPRRVFFAPDGTAYTPNNFSSTGGKLLAKPDFTAADGVTTNVKQVGGDQPFYGTSCATPHAGALAALLLSYRPTYTPAQIAAALRGGTVQLNFPGAGNRDSGAGVLLASNIFQAVNTPPSILSVSPANGPAGTVVTITGINLNTAVNVTFNGVPAPFQLTSATALTATVPSGATTGPVGIQTAGGVAFSAGNFTLTASVATPVITSAASASGQVDSLFNYQITATNGPASYGASGLPPGVAFNPATGLVSGVPTAPGTFVATIAAVNAPGGAGTAVLTITIAPAAPAIVNPGPLSAQVGAPFSYQIVATNAPTAYGASGLPAGLTVNSATGLIVGTPTVAGAYAVTLGASNGGGLNTLAVSLTVTTAPPVITSAPSASAMVGTPFAYQITGTNAPTSFAASGLPPGLVVDPATGFISGTPTSAGTYAVGLGAGNAGGTGSGTLTLTVAVPPNVLPTVTVMATVNSAHLAAGIPGTITFNRSGGDLTKKLVVNFKVKGSAANGKDYVMLTGSKKIKPNKASASIQIVPRGDLGGAGSKKVKLVVLPGAAYVIGGTPTVAVKIINN